MTRRILILGALGIAFALLALFGLSQCRNAQTASTRAMLETGRADAASKSGNDAVNTLGNQMTNEVAADRITQENQDAIDHANGSDSAVHPDARAAGVQSLCRRASYRASHPECVQPAPAR